VILMGITEHKSSKHSLESQLDVILSSSMNGSRAHQPPQHGRRHAPLPLSEAAQDSQEGQESKEGKWEGERDVSHISDEILLITQEATVGLVVCASLLVCIYRHGIT